MKSIVPKTFPLLIEVHNFIYLLFHLYVVPPQFENQAQII